MDHLLDFIKREYPGGRSTKFYTAMSRKVCRKKVHATIPKGNLGRMINTLFLTLQLSNLLLLLSFSNLNDISMASLAILSNFFEEQ